MYDLNFVKDYPVKVELHAHTYPASGCGHVSPENTVDTYAKDGADAIVITNHFYPGMLGRDCWKNFSPAEIIECYLDDYYKAQKRGKEIGVSVIFGVELRFEENINDYLVYGLEPSDLVNVIPYFDKGISEFYRDYKSDSRLIFQAHPFRKGMELAPLDSIDGIESFNVHPNHNSCIGLAAKYVRENSLLSIGGTDFHEPERFGLCYMRCKSVPKDMHDIVKILRSRDYFLDISGSYVFPYNN